MPPDLLNGILVEVTGVPEEALTDAVRVLQTLEDIINEGDLAPLPELNPLVLAAFMDHLHPAVVLRR